MAERKFLFMAADGYGEEAATTDHLNVAGLMIGAGAYSAGKITGLTGGTADAEALAYGQSSANLAGLTIDTSALIMSSQQITGLADGSSADHAVNKGQLDNAVIQGGTMKEFLLHEDQLDDAEGVLASIALVMANQPISGDLITTYDGTTTREYGAVAGGDVQYALGGTAAITMQNLVDAINGDGTATVSAALSTDLEAIGTTVVVLTELDNDGGAHRLYGVWTTQADCDVVDFTGELNYSKKTLTDMPAADPTTSNFGIRRTLASLTPGELHYVDNDDTIYGWDGDADVWNAMSGGTSIPDATSASGGGVKGKVTFDSDKGLSVTAGVAEALISVASGLEFSTGSIAINLEASEPSLQAVGNELGVKINTAAGLEKGASGLGINLEASNPTLDVVSTELGVKFSTTTGGLDQDSDGLKVKVDGSTITINGSGQLVGASADEATRLENTVTATENLTKADPVYWNSTADECGKADAGTDAKAFVFGIAKADISAAAAGEIVSYGPAAGVLTAATPGAKYYLGDGGGITTSIPGAGKRVIMIGWAISTTALWVQPVDYGKKAA